MRARSAGRGTGAGFAFSGYGVKGDLLNEAWRSARVGWVPVGCYRLRLQHPLGQALAVRCAQVMSSSDDRERRLIIRQVVVGLTVTSATAVAEIATYSGPIDERRVILFGISGLLSSTVALLATIPLKKNAYFV